jgi:ribosome recycling factor
LSFLIVFNQTKVGKKSFILNYFIINFIVSTISNLYICNSKKIIMTAEDAQIFIDDAKETMAKALEHLESELSKVRAGKASPQMLAGLVVDYYGTPTPISQVSNINNTDSRTLVVQPWEKNMLTPIERVILGANLGVTPLNDGQILRLVLPPLTEERRKELVKATKVIGEAAKVAIRNIRRDAIEGVKKLQKDGLSEDVIKDSEAEIQEVTDKYITTTDRHLEAKEKEIMTV